MERRLEVLKEVVENLEEVVENLFLGRRRIALPNLTKSD
jgi:hypothetical protein